MQELQEFRVQMVDIREIGLLMGGIATLAKNKSLRMNELQLMQYKRLNSSNNNDYNTIFLISHFFGPIINQNYDHFT